MDGLDLWGKPLDCVIGPTNLLTAVVIFFFAGPFEGCGLVFLVAAAAGDLVVSWLDDGKVVDVCRELSAEVSGPSDESVVLEVAAVVFDIAAFGVIYLL